MSNTFFEKAVLAGMLGLAFSATTVWAMSTLHIGILTCDASQGIDATDTTIVCDFDSDEDSPSEAYTGIIEKIDSKIEAAEGAHLVWEVFSSSPKLHAGDLAGDYASIEAGVLAGGHAKAFTLRSTSIDGISGAAFSVIRITLVASN